ncbi:peptide/nickel transport system permease protein [Paenibacillus cellulosilyticus]|uniref:Peptide/nickel transport system permease protein n=1 Tax=Paenibacillus cellulosilyticus TaxID=375489 RepID=A0A2V2YUE2_9BACL|nr:ABC transporter permease [Paenibacillus cellulosilyticus]PWW03306.1 peptide/nickel transport system permease protein [Paenibacillus cellulosilyticus]QKS43782.1 ABC transporter permease [Paenibacillus cellulosilyticus]
MVKYIINRLILAVPVILGSLTLVFLIIHWLPGDPARMLAGDDHAEDRIQYLQEQLGLNRPLWVQYFTYLWDSMRGDFGHSFANQQPVMDRLLSQLPSTAELAVVSTIFAIITGITLGILSAVYRNRLVDYVIRIVSLFGVSMPKFWLGILLILIFSVHLHLLPAIGNGSFKQVILPAFALGVTGAGILARMVRNSILEVIEDPFVTTLRAKGVTERKVLYLHVLRNALLPSLTIIGVIFVGMLEGAVVTETVFARQGIGKMVVDAIGQKDIPVIQASILICAVFNIVVNLLVDISYSFVDPRVRQQSA